jgi:hypothetical protein
MFKYHTQCCTYSDPQTNEPDTSDHVLLSPSRFLISRYLPKAFLTNKIVVATVTLQLVIAPWSELSWQALNLHTPGALPPHFLSIAVSGVLCMAVLLPWGVLMRRNSAAHRRVLILATICISDAGFSRFVSLFLPAPTGFLGTYLFYEGGNVLLILLMFLWDWKRNRIMKQFLWGAFLVTAVGLAATGLYFNETWKSISRAWLEGWARNML